MLDLSLDALEPWLSSKGRRPSLRPAVKKPPGLRADGFLRTEADA